MVLYLLDGNLSQNCAVKQKVRFYRTIFALATVILISKKGLEKSKMLRNQSQNSIEVEQLAAARRGDSQQFSGLTERYRRELQVHCYRILGSLHEAEDMVQETMLKAWKRRNTFEGRASFRSWLYKIATNSCLDFLDQKKSRRLLPFET